MKLLRFLYRDVRLTQLGLYFLAAVVTFGIASVFSDSNLLYLVFAFFLALAVLSLPAGKRSLAGLAAARKLPGRSFAGEPSFVRLEVSNESDLAAASIEVTDSILEQSRAREFNSVIFEDIPPGTVQSRTYQASFNSRGEYNFKAISISTTFPFGLFRISRTVSASETHIVLPRRGLVRLTSPYEEEHATLFHGETSFTRGMEEFVTIRDFRPGDNPKWIHWKATSRLPEGLLVRDFSDPGIRTAQVVLDRTISPGEEDDFETCIDVAASLLQELSNHGYSLQFCLVGEDFEVHESHATLGRLDDLLEILALVQSEKVNVTNQFPADEFWNAEIDRRFWISVCPMQSERTQGFEILCPKFQDFPLRFEYLESNA